jgi:hypothetical protein
MTLMVFALCAATASAVQPLPAYNGGNGITSFGVASYGAPVPGVPTYIPNNFTGLNDILSSPGGTFQTANPVIANNIASYGPGALPSAFFQVGGGNVNGAFGAGTVTNVGTGVGFTLADSGPAGGSASYEIASWNANYTAPAGYAGTYGNVLSIGGVLPAVGSAAVAALQTEVTSANPASPFFGGVALPQLVLADAEIAPGVFSWVAVGGTGAAILTNLAGGYSGLAFNSAVVAIPVGDAFTVTSTLTVYADPASIDTIAPDLSLLPGFNLPTFDVGAVTPEPGSIVLAGMGVVALAWAGFNRRKRA